MGVDDFGNVTYEDTDTTNSTVPPNDPNAVFNRTVALRKAYWKYLYRLPTQAEFNQAAFGRQGQLIPKADFDATVNSIPGSEAAVRAKTENKDKWNDKPVPEGADFGESTGYDPRATGETKPPPPGGAQNLDRTFLLEQIRADAEKQGITLTPEREEYWIGKASQPDLYSDGKWRVGWNPYWAAKLGGATSADPALAGSAGIVSAPAGYVGGGSSESGTASSAATAETPAARAARLATFGLGPEGLQNQRPGEMPTPPTLGDMMGQQGPIANPGTYTPGAAYQAPEYRAPDPYQQATPFDRPEYQAATPFVAPTAADMGQDPGYQFRLSEGQKALERSGAARGVTNTGGNMKGLLDYGQQAASQEYGNVYNRNLNTYNTNEANRAGAYQTNYGNALSAYNTNEANRAGAYGTNAANAFQQYSTNALANNTYNQDTEARKSGAFGTNTNLYQQQQTDAYNRSQQAYNDAMAAYQAKTTNQRNYERDRANDLFRVAGI